MLTRDREPDPEPEPEPDPEPESLLSFLLVMFRLVLRLLSSLRLSPEVLAAEMKPRGNNSSV